MKKRTLTEEATLHEVATLLPPEFLVGGFALDDAALALAAALAVETTDGGREKTHVPEAVAAGLVAAYDNLHGVKRLPALPTFGERVGSGWRVSVTADADNEAHADFLLSELEDVVGRCNGDLLLSDQEDLDVG